jgi:hypothetical protein
MREPRFRAKSLFEKTSLKKKKNKIAFDVLNAKELMQKL